VDSFGKGFAAKPFLFLCGPGGPREKDMGGFTDGIRAALGVIRQVNRERATEMIEFELKELENIFTLLVIGGFVGMPAPPTPIAIELLPLLERELSIMLSRSDFAQDPLGALMGILQVD